MDDKRALEIVKRLADGLDPTTGEIFPPGSPYQNAETVRALHKAEEALKRTAKIDAQPENAGKPWKTEESDALARRFDAGAKIVELAKEHERTKYAIMSQLKKLGKIEN